MSGREPRWSDQIHPSIRAAEWEPAPASATGSIPKLFHIRLLGGFEVASGSRILDARTWRRRKAGHIVKFLALQPRRQLHRDQILEALWPDVSETASRNNYRVTLHAARRILEDRLGIKTAIIASGETMELAPGITTDVQDFERAANVATGSKNPILYCQALSLYTGDLLPEDQYEEWTLQPREQLRNTYLDLLIALATLHEDRGEFEEAVRLSREAVQIDPLNEEAHVVLMRSLALSGRRSAAIRQFAELRRVLEHDLDVEPEPVTRVLYDDLLAGRFPDHSRGLIDISPMTHGSSVRSTVREAPRHNLPAALTRFVGRQSETEAVRQQLASSRLVSITAPGGSGKTRLALNVAENVIDEYPDGVWLVELSDIVAPDLVLPSISSVLSVRDAREGSLLDRVIESLHDRRMLVILDSCELLVETVAELVDQLLQSCPELCVLCTSQEALGVPGEAVRRLPSMNVPDAGQRASAADVRGFEAVELFIDRVMEVHPSFELTDANLDEIAVICRRLDGSPLAIELAAARVGVLSLREIASRLDDALSLLTTGPRTAPDRQQTLRATLDWSFRLLLPTEKALLQRCSVFAGGFTLRAAEAVASADIDGDVPVIDAIASLISKSLLQREELPDGELRFRMLETVRSYGWKLLEQSGIAEKIQFRHAEYFLLVAEQSEPLVYGANGAAVLDDLELEHDNFRQAIGWLSVQQVSEAGLRLTSALAPFWWMRGYLVEGFNHLQSMLQLSDDLPESQLPRARALGLAAALAEARDDFSQTETLGAESLRLYADLDSQMGSPAPCLCLGVMAYKKGERGTARGYWEAALAAARFTGEIWLEGMALNNLGSWALGERELDQARDWLVESLRIARGIGNKNLIAQPLAYLGEVAMAREDYAEAERLLTESLTCFQDVGERRFSGRVLGSLSVASLKQGLVERAGIFCRQSIDLLWQSGERYHLAQSLDVLAQILVRVNQADEAAELFGSLAALRNEMGFPVPPEILADHEQALADLRSLLETDVFDAAWQSGYERELRQTVENALENGPQ